MRKKILNFLLKELVENLDEDLIDSLLDALENTNNVFVCFLCKLIRLVTNTPDDDDKTE